MSKVFNTWAVATLGLLTFTTACKGNLLGSGTAAITDGQDGAAIGIIAVHHAERLWVYDPDGRAKINPETSTDDGVRRAALQITRPYFAPVECTGKGSADLVRQLQDASDPQMSRSAIFVDESRAMVLLRLEKVDGNAKVRSQALTNCKFITKYFVPYYSMKFLEQAAGEITKWKHEPQELLAKGAKDRGFTSARELYVTAQAFYLLMRGIYKLNQQATSTPLYQLTGMLAKDFTNTEVATRSGPAVGGGALVSMQDLFNKDRSFNPCVMESPDPNLSASTPAFLKRDFNAFGCANGANGVSDYKPKISYSALRDDIQRTLDRIMDHDFAQRNKNLPQRSEKLFRILSSTASLTAQAEAAEKAGDADTIEILKVLLETHQDTDAEKARQLIVARNNEFTNLFKDGAQGGVSTTALALDDVSSQSAPEPVIALNLGGMGGPFGGGKGGMYPGYGANPAGGGAYGPVPPGTILPDGSKVLPNGTVLLPDGTTVVPYSTWLQNNGGGLPGAGLPGMNSGLIPGGNPAAQIGGGAGGPGSGSYYTAPGSSGNVSFIQHVGRLIRRPIRAISWFFKGLLGPWNRAVLPADRSGLSPGGIFGGPGGSTGNFGKGVGPGSPGYTGFPSAQTASVAPVTAAAAAASGPSNPLPGSPLLPNSSVLSQSMPENLPAGGLQETSFSSGAAPNVATEAEAEEEGPTPVGTQSTQKPAELVELVDAARRNAIIAGLQNFFIGGSPVELGTSAGFPTGKVVQVKTKK